MSTGAGAPSGPPRVWVLADDRAGNRSQAVGVAEALGWPYEIKEIRYGTLGRLPNAVLGASFLGLAAESRRRLIAPWPDLVIAAGRRTAPAARRIKRRSGGHAFLVQLMDPGRAGVNEFDLVVIPNHDDAAGGANAMRVTGAPHRVTTKALAEAAGQWRERFADLPRPWFALIVGGTTRRRAFTPAMARELGRAANRMAEDADGALLITTSRRTEAAAADALLAEISVPWFVHRWERGGDNPYLGMLALADTVIVTGDSVSMCSEACLGRAPVYVFAPEALIAPKHARLHRELFENGYACPLGGPNGGGELKRLDAAAEIAAEVRRRLGKRE